MARLRLRRLWEEKEEEEEKAPSTKEVDSGNEMEEKDSEVVANEMGSAEGSGKEEVKKKKKEDVVNLVTGSAATRETAMAEIVAKARETAKEEVRAVVLQKQAILTKMGKKWRPTQRRMWGR